MTYTFDDAIKELEQDVFWTTGFPELPEIEFEKVKAVFGKMREEYAPTVEMTSQEIKVFANYVNSDTPPLIKKMAYYDRKVLRELGHRKLAQAWLHPEAIKVVDE